MSAKDTSSSNRQQKSEGAFRTISEVATDLDVPQHVLRFWESKFSQVRPLKRGGGRRYYRPEDVVLLRRIRTLLYDDGLTIKGVQKLFRDHGVKAVVEPKAMPVPGTPVNREQQTALAAAPAGPSPELTALLSELKGLRTELRNALRAC